VNFSKLSLGFGYRWLAVRLVGQITCIAGSNTAANTGRGDEWAAVSKIELLQDGSDVIASLTGDQLWWLNRNQYAPRTPQVTSTLADGTTANPSFNSVLLIPIWPERVVNPVDFTYDARLVQDYKLQITWGNYTDVNSAASGWAVNPSIEVIGVLDTLEDMPPDKSGFDLHRIITTTKTFSSTDPNARFDLPLGNLRYMDLIINTAVAGTDTSACFSNVMLKSGSTVFLDMSEQALRELSNAWIRATNSGGAGSLRRSNKSNADAWYNLTLLTDGYKTEAVDAYGVAELFLEFNLTTASTITTVNNQFIPAGARR
jgi:hypothetical protein